MTTTTEPRPIECEHEWPVLSPCPECGVDAVEAAAAPLPLDVETLTKAIAAASLANTDGSWTPPPHFYDDFTFRVAAEYARLSVSTGRPADEERAVLDAAKKVLMSQTVSGSTLAPGQSGIGGQMITGWIRAEPFEELLEATYALMRETERASTGRSTATGAACTECNGSGSVDTNNGPDCCSKCGGSGATTGEEQP
jgi:hypothetical protein